MAEYLVREETLAGLADKIRALKGITESMSLDDMETELDVIPKNDSTDLTVSGATITVPAGYYATHATKSVATATQATPSISVDANGKITASATQTAGYVTAGTKSGTKQLTTQAAKTITPTKSSQTAVASGVYTTGAVTVAAIPSQYITTTDATAKADSILKDETAYVDGEKVTGAMPNNGAVSSTMDGIDVKSITIPAGYTSGGTVSLDDTIDNEVDTQADLIAQIASALEGKAGGGSGGVETCTVTIDNQLGSYFHEVAATQCNAGQFNSYFIDYNTGLTTVTIENVVCNSTIFVKTVMAIIPAFSINGTAEILYSQGNIAIWLFKAPSIAGESCTITLRDDD